MFQGMWASFFDSPGNDHANSGCFVMELLIGRMIGAITGAKHGTQNIATKMSSNVNYNPPDYNVAIWQKM